MFVFDVLRHSNALLIANDWKYEEPYSFYDMTADMEDYNELVDESSRNGCEYFEATVNGELVGFFSLSRDEDEIEIGLGLKPELCGRGMGRAFVESVVQYVNESDPGRALCMCVAAFNARAIKVYKACGFEEQETYMQAANGGRYEFVKLIRR